MTTKINESQKMTEELLTYLSEFFRQTNPNPFVAIAAIEIYKNELFIDTMFDLLVENAYVHLGKIYINDEEIEEFLSLLREFMEESKEKIRQKGFYIVPATYIIIALEISKHQFLAKVTKIVS